MKKLSYLFYLILVLCATGCDKDNDMPDVNVLLELDNAIEVDNEIYVIKDTPIEISSVEAEGIGSTALITNVTYFIDGIRVAFSPIAPFRMVFDTEYARPGRHILALNCEVAQEGKSLGFVMVSTTINVIDDSESLPEGSEPGKVTVRFTDKPQ